MGKIVRLTEADLVRLVKKVVNEQGIVDTVERLAGNTNDGWNSIKKNLMKYRPKVDDPHFGERLINGESAEKLTFELKRQSPQPKDTSDDNPSLTINSSGGVDFTIIPQFINKTRQGDTVIKNDMIGLQKFKNICSQNNITPKLSYKERGGFLHYTTEPMDMKKLYNFTVQIINSFGLEN